MGNRAFITHKDAQNGVYLHWNGGLDSVKPLLDYCKLFDPEGGFDASGEGVATFANVAENMLGGSVYIDPNYGTMVDDNGTYWIEGWEIVGREAPYLGEEQLGHDYQEMLNFINESQPEERQVSKEKLAELYREHSDWLNDR